VNGGKGRWGQGGVGSVGPMGNVLKKEERGKVR